MTEDPRIARAQRLVEQADRLLHRANESLVGSPEDTEDLEGRISRSRQDLAISAEAISERTGRSRQGIPPARPLEDSQDQGATSEA